MRFVVTKNEEKDLVISAVDTEEIDVSDNPFGLFVRGMGDYVENGSFVPFVGSDSTRILGMANAPCIAESIEFENGEAMIFGDIWFFENHAKECFMQKIKNEGSVIFKRVL